MTLTKAQKREAREERLARKEKHKLRLSPLETDVLGRALVELRMKGDTVASGVLTKLEKITGKKWWSTQITGEVSEETAASLEKRFNEPSDWTPSPDSTVTTKVYTLQGKTVVHYQQSPLVFLSACGLFIGDQSIEDNAAPVEAVTCKQCQKTLRNEGLLV